MGTNCVTEIFEASNEKAALKVAKEIMERARYERGHDAYGGHIGTARGIEIARQVAPLSREKADELAFGICNKEGYEVVAGLCEKHGPAVLIRIRNKGSRKRLWALCAAAAS